MKVHEVEDLYQNFSNDDKMTLLWALQGVAGIDGLEEVEEEYINNLALELGVDFDKECESLTFEDFMQRIAKVENRRVALEIVKQMFILAYSDDDFSEEEGVFICQVCEGLKVEKEKAEEISQWVVDKLELSYREYEIFEEC